MTHRESQSSMRRMGEVAASAAMVPCGDMKLEARPSQARMLLSEPLARSMAVVAAVALAYLVNLPVFKEQQTVSLAALVFVAVAGGYLAGWQWPGAGAPKGWTHLFSALVQVVVIGLVILLALPVADLGNPEQRRFLASLPVFAFVLNLGIGACNLTTSKRPGLIERIALYGTGSVLEDVALAVARDRGAMVVAIFRERESGSVHAGQGSRSSLTWLLEFVQSGGCDKVILALPDSETSLLSSALAHLEACPLAVQVCTDPRGSRQEPLPSSILGGLPLQTVQERPIGSIGLLAKATVDTILSAAALLALSPVLLAIAIAIKLDSEGPIFFVQRRGGFCNRRIRVLKFRTMSVCEDGPVVQQAENNDPRITRVGRFLRRTSLDELPQLFNVLAGDMSLVGPRPHAIAHDQFYQSNIEHYLKRMRVKPGLTGWAQVHNLRGNTRDMDLMRARVEHDIYYVENWSLGLDFRIMFRTLAVLLSSDRAY